MLERVDFHTHFTDSTAAQIIDQAKQYGVVAMGLIGRLEISDKFDEFVTYGKEHGISVIPGVECLVLVENKYVDVVAIGFNCNHPDVRKYWGKAEKVQDNAKIAGRQKSFLDSSGFVFNGLSQADDEELEALLKGDITEKAILFCQIIARCLNNESKIRLLQKEFKQEWEDIRNKYSGRPTYAKREDRLVAKFLYLHYFSPSKPGHIQIQPQATDIIQSVHRAGGVVCYSPEGEFDNEIWKVLLDLEIDGVMGWHGGKLELSGEIVREITKKGLLILGGGDFDPDKMHWEIGIGKGDMYLSTRRLTDLRRRLAKYEQVK